MARRPNKVKKVADTKEVETDIPKMVKGKANVIEEQENDIAETEPTEKQPSDKQTKRGKKVAKENGQEPNIEQIEDTVPKKKGKNKISDSSNEDKSTNSDKSTEKSSPSDVKQNGDAEELNGDSKESQVVNGKGGKKKQKVDSKPKESGRVRKPKQPENSEKLKEKDEEEDEKPKSTSKGRGRKAQTKVENGSEEGEKADLIEEEPKPITKGRKKPTVAKKKSSENEDDHIDENNKVEEPEEEPKKKETKGMKKEGKKNLAKEESNENEDDHLDENNKVEEPEEEPKKKETKGKKKEGKKNLAKEESNENEDDHLDENNKVEEPEEEPKKKETKGKKKEGKKNLAKEESNEKSDEPAAKKRRNAKKDDKAKGDVNEEPVEEEIIEEKATKGKKAQKKASETTAGAEEEPADTGEQPTKRRRKNVEEKAPTEDKKKAALKNKAATNYEDLDFTNTSKNTHGKEWNFKISSWNVDGIRAWFSKGGLDYLQHEKPDILCLQETKCSQDKLPDELVDVPGYHAYWLCSNKDGYAGVGIYTSKLAMNVQYGLQNEELDSEGRIITAEYEHFYLINTYVPNAGRKLVTLPKRLQWNDEFRKYVKDLDKKKPVIICGDMNVAHNEIDLANPKTNRKNAGFTDEERSGMTDLLGDGFVDTFRHLNPDKTGSYTFWTYMMNSRAKNVGWRLDYFIVSERLLPSICDSVIRNGVYGSDHCPISMVLHLSSADKPK